MAGLVPAIHVFEAAKKGVDARVKPGHDEQLWLFPAYPTFGTVCAAVAHGRSAVARPIRRPWM